jgi:hypothetical protein
MSVNVREGESYRLNVEKLLKQNIKNTLDILKTENLLFHNEIDEVEYKLLNPNISLLELEELLLLLEGLSLYKPNYI